MQRRAISLVIAALLPVVAGRVFGLVGVATGGCVALLVVVARHDNDAGTCLPLAVLLLLSIAVLVLLVVLLAVTR
jgi:hypothetical protein